VLYGHKEAGSIQIEAEPLAGDKPHKVIAESREILSDERFILQKGIRSLVDKDARVGASGFSWAPATDAPVGSAGGRHGLKQK